MITGSLAGALVLSILKLFCMSAAGYLAVRFEVVSERTVRVLSRIVITVTLPCLIIVTLGTQLEYRMLGALGQASLAALALNGTGLALALVFRRIFIHRHRKGPLLFLSLSSMQNSGYLPIPLVAAVLPEDLRSQGLLLVFVYIMVMGTLFWSLGIWLITEGAARNWKENIKKTANPPIMAMFLGCIFLFRPVRDAFSSMTVLSDFLSIIGSATIPLVLFILGGSFAVKVPTEERDGRIVGISAVIKLLMIPALTLLAVKTAQEQSVFGFVLILQASMPAALNHVVVAREYGGNAPLIARALCVQYLLSMVTIPIFLYLFGRL